MTTRAWLLPALMFCCGCSSVGPKYRLPSAPTPTAYKGQGAWAHARPSDGEIHGEWWKIFGDPELNGLEAQVSVSNQNIAASFAAYQQARAIVKEARAEYFPHRCRRSERERATLSEHHEWRAGLRHFHPVLGVGQRELGADLWGRIRNSVKEDIANAQMSAADLENERLLEQSDLAIYYYEIRAQDSLQRLYDETVVAYGETLRLTRALSKTGIDSDEAVAQAELQLKLAEAQATNLGIARAQYEHAIAMLVGKPASSFSLPVATLQVSPPSIPASVPSKLLERRPDIAAAERAVAAANAQIGVAMAAYFPNLALSASTGVGSTSLGGLFSAPVFFWSLGSSLAETVFDAGLRSATVEQYKAAYEQTVATYRQTVLAAFQQVEDGLAGLKFLSRELDQQEWAVSSANRYLRIATARYKAGIDPYLDVITAQTAVLSAEQTEITVRMQELTTSVQLIEALGGGWDRSRLPSEKGL